MITDKHLQLASMMSGLCRGATGLDWIERLEIMLWGMVTDDNHRGLFLRTVKDEVVATLKSLSEEVHAWVCCPDGSSEDEDNGVVVDDVYLVFVPLDE